MKYYILYVGDDPGDETCQGPYPSMEQALKNMSDGHLSYYVLHSPVQWVGRNIRGWNAPISSLYIVGHDKEGRPTWERDVLPVLKLVRSGVIKREYDEE